MRLRFRRARRPLTAGTYEVRQSLGGRLGSNSVSLGALEKPRKRGVFRFRPPLLPLGRLAQIALFEMPVRGLRGLDGRVPKLPLHVDQRQSTREPRRGPPYRRIALRLGVKFAIATASISTFFPRDLFGRASRAMSRRLWRRDRATRSLTLATTWRFRVRRP